MPNKYDVQAQRQELDRLVRERAWTAFRAHFTKLSSSNQEHCRSVVESHHRQTSHRTLLHYMCDLESNQPPSDIIDLVVSTCPRALFTADPNQRFPLHLAIRREVRINTVRALIEPITEDQFSKEKVLNHRDISSSTPLLLATKMDAENREEIIRYLVDQDTSGQSLLNPKETKKHKHKTTSPLKFVATREILFVDDGLDNPDDLLRFMIVQTYCPEMKDRMIDIYNDDNDFNDNQMCLLQASIICHELFGSTKLASSIISAIIRNQLYHPNYLDIARNNILHVACLSSTSLFNQILKLGQRETQYGINFEDCTLIEFLIRSNSGSDVMFLSRNNFGDIPLHCAVRTRKDILHVQQMLRACEKSVEVYTKKGELPLHLALKYGSEHDTIMLLWKTYPYAALIRDKPTGLYLFQLAVIDEMHSRQNTGCGATHHSSNRRRKREAKGNVKATELDRVSLSYYFLRECPEVVAYFH